MSGISSKAAGTLVNKHLYSGKELNNKEFSDGSGLETYDFGARDYDPQIGRWNSPDQMADKWNSYSPYNYAVNNPINVTDPDGKDAIFSYDAKTNILTITAKIYYQGKDLPKDAKERAALMTTINDNLKAMYKDGTGKDGDNEWNVKFDVTASINEDVKQGNLKAGENIMTIDKGNAGLDQTDGTKRSNVGGDKLNIGYLQNKAGSWTDTHEIGHMLGFSDRYTDYQNGNNVRDFHSFTHDGYQGDVMGTYNGKQLNQSHYDDAVRFTNFKLNVAQKNLLPELRSNSTNVTTLFDHFTQSATCAEDIPKGWIKK